MDLRKLHRCTVVAELGSFTRAAAVLGMPQPVLSRHVRDVERDLAIRLFHRNGRGAVLTEAGEALMPRLCALVADADQLGEAARRLQAAPSGAVRLGVLASLAPLVLTPLLTAAAERLPRVRIQVVEGLTEHVDELLAAGRLDIGLLYDSRQAPSPTDERLLETELHLVGWPGDTLTLAATLPCARLSHLPLTVPDRPNPHRLLVEKLCRDAGATLAVAAGVNAIGTMKDIAAAGRAHTILPLHAVAADVSAGRLQAARLVEPRVGRTILLATATRRPPSRATEAVSELVRELAAALARSGALPGCSVLR